MERAPVQVVADVLETVTPSGPMAVLRKRPAGRAAWPRAVVFHDGPGIRRATHQFAAMLAAEGYDVFVPDLYHRHGRLIGYELHEREADPSLVDRLWELLQSLTDDGMQADLDVTLDAAGVGPDERFAVIGFCVGARAVHGALVRLPGRIAAGAMWHPSFLADDGPGSPHLTAGAITVPLYIGVGDADRMQPIERNRPYFDAVAPLEHVTVEVHAGADHAYTWPGWPTYDAAAAGASFRRTTALFAEHLGRAPFG